VTDQAAKTRRADGSRSGGATGFWRRADAGERVGRTLADVDDGGGPGAPLTESLALFGRRERSDVRRLTKLLEETRA
jgi:hypothetical protein